MITKQLIIKHLDDIKNTKHAVDFGMGMNFSFLTQSDDTEFTLTDTYIDANSNLELQYNDRLQACYIIEGSGELSHGDNITKIEPGLFYAFDKYNKHKIKAFSDIRMICVFSPALEGTEKRDFFGGAGYHRRRKKFVIAICYDFDGTLIRGNMQENSFIPEIGMDKDDFWNNVKQYSKKHDMDEVLAYMELMLAKAEGKTKVYKKSLEEHGKNVELFPGVESWFNDINNYTKNKYKNDVSIEHYIISSGLDEMIKGSPIGVFFEHIYASGFVYDDIYGIATSPARSINYTNKVQYLFRINKGIHNSWDNSEINKYTPKEARPIPFSRMIYIGDGETDVPAMKMLNSKRGYSIAVYPPKKGGRITNEEKKKKESVEKLQKVNRVQYIAEANYEKDGRLYNIVTSIIDRIADELRYSKNLKAH